MSPRVVLVAPPGVEVERIAAALGSLLDLPVRDTDRDVEALAGASVAEIFVESGESLFRDLERQAVVAALAEHDGVLVVGGGAVMDPRTEADLAAHRVVLLDVSITYAARVLGLTGATHVVNPRAQWLRMMETRRPVYARVASLTVSTDGRQPDDVASEIAAAVS